jgi:hypothetical protein
MVFLLFSFTSDRSPPLPHPFPFPMKLPVRILACLYSALFCALAGRTVAAPVAVNDSYSTPEDTPLVISNGTLY